MAGLTPIARRLRRDQTEVERLLWSRLRGRRLAGWKFRRQMPIGSYVVDFFCPDAWVIFELDGGQHSRDRDAIADRIRSLDLETAGYLVARFWNQEIIDNLDGVSETIVNLVRGAPAALDRAAHDPQPA